MNKLLTGIATLFLWQSAAMAQDNQPHGMAVQGVQANVSTLNVPTIITTGNTFQVVLPSNLNTGIRRQSLTIENNNATDNCFILIGGPWAAGDTTATSRTINGVSITSVKDGILLLPGGQYTRYWPLVPSDQILATCASTSDSLYVDVQ